MIVDIVNDLILYVEPQRKAQSERNRVALGLMSESQVRTAILRDQESLRQFVADQRNLERYLWTVARQVMSSLDVAQTQPVLFGPGESVAGGATDAPGLSRSRTAGSVPRRPLPMSIQYVQFASGRSNVIREIISGDEAWVYSFDPEIKQQSAL
ncbi:unnamed protein product [Echinostoma caproni]|uniref:Nup54 domain-containing protein n=1 Tax=Echinostoma caproni TaxID=27848 RepID=A0A183A034_9TREM|nr:unnamed protein product [Echinostoma caproni]